MKIEVGKKYVRRDGVVVGPMVDSWYGEYDEYPFGDGDEEYTNEGHYRVSREPSVFDLISEYIDPTQAGFVVGETYDADAKGRVKIIAIEGDRAFGLFELHGSDVPSSYAWSLDGEYLCAISSEREPYRIKLKPKVEWVTVVARYSYYPEIRKGYFYGQHKDTIDHNNHNINITFPLINGKHDWSQAKIEAV